VGGEPIRVLLCDDAPGFRPLMRYALEEDPSVVVVGEPGDGEATAVVAIRDAVRAAATADASDRRS
jgi:Tfp pilus assembly pilus retraction ATPase PilT